jgi:hypothetical protein
MKAENTHFMELKYCEQCGGLWLRRVGSGEDLCQRCRCAVAHFTNAWRRALLIGQQRPKRVRSWFEARWLKASCRAFRGGRIRRTHATA